MHFLLVMQKFTSQLSKSAIDMNPWFIFVEEREWGWELFSNVLYGVLRTKAVYNHLHLSTPLPPKPNALT